MSKISSVQFGRATQPTTQQQGLYWPQYGNIKVYQAPALALSSAYALNSSGQMPPTPVAMLDKSNIKPGADEKKEDDALLSGFEPHSPLGEKALGAGKLSVGMSGLAGMINGMRAKMPLMTLGEAGVAISSPWAETVWGWGMFLFGLGCLFSARALETDPSKRINSHVLRTKKGLGKAKYLLGNVGNTFAVLAQSTAKTFSNLGKLIFGNKTERQKAANFFNYEFLNFRENTIELTEAIDHRGKSIVKMGMKNSPHFMNTASFMLLTGSALLVAGTALKNSISQRLGFRTGAVGGSLDNLSLAKQGVTRLYTPGKAGSGPVYTAAGLTILPGQQWANKEWGRGMMWTATSLLFTAFSIDAWTSFREILASNKQTLKSVATSEVRKLNVIIHNLLNNKTAFPNGTVMAFNKSNDGLDKVTNYVNSAAADVVGNYAEELRTLESLANDPAVKEELKLFTQAQYKDWTEKLHKAVSSGNKDAVNAVFEPLYSLPNQRGGTPFQANLLVANSLKRLRDISTSDALLKHVKAIRELQEHSEAGRTIVNTVQNAIRELNGQGSHFRIVEDFDGTQKIVLSNWGPEADQKITEKLNKAVPRKFRDAIQVSIDPDSVTASQQSMMDALSEIAAVNRDRFKQPVLENLYAEGKQAMIEEARRYAEQNAW
ncbi:MAG: hypothetical protein AAGI66_08315 [Cyanobacteria bacterium P01_H01_bin.74]